MRKINFKKISLLMIMLVAFSILIMPSKVDAVVGDTWSIKRLYGTGEGVRLNTRIYCISLWSYLGYYISYKIW